MSARSAYNRDTGPILAAGIGGLFVATAVTHYLAGASMIGLLLGDGGAGLAPAAALSAAFSQLDLIIAAVFHPRAAGATSRRFTAAGAGRHGD